MATLATFTVTIGGTTLPQVPTLLVLPGLDIDDAINARTVCRFDVLDVLGMQHFKQGQAVTVTDVASGTVLFAGFVASSVETQPSLVFTSLRHQITCQDNHYLADKRDVATSYAAGQTCGGIAQDLINNWLLSEGVYSIKNVLTANQSDVETDTTGFVAANSATLTRDTTQAWHGVASLKCVTPGTVSMEGFSASAPTASYVNGETVTASVYLRGSGTVTLALVQPGVFTVATSAPITLTTTWTRYSLTGTLPNPLTGGVTYGLQVVTNSIQAVTFNADGLQIEPYTSATVWELGGTTSIQTGPAISGTLTYNYKPASYVLDQAAQLAGYSWYIDAYRRLWFFSVATFTAPWTFDGSQQGTYPSTSVEHYNKGYRNSEYVLGATEVTTAQTETRKGDGSTRAFPLGFPIHQTPSDVHVNAGAAQTIGIKGVSTGKQWYWSKGDNNLYQDPGQVVLAATDVLSVTYIGHWQVVAYAQDANQIAIELAREGVGTGIVENATLDTKLTTAAQAFQEASALLAEYSSEGTILTFKTIQSGLVASQMLTVALPAPFNVSGQFLIERVRLTYEPGVEASLWWYEVTATQGPVSETWIQWFSRLIQPPSSIIDVSSLGQQTIVSLLQTTNETWTWTESVVETVNACFVFPVTFPKTFC